MRVLTPELSAVRPAPAFRWSPLRALAIVCAYAAPLALLCLRLRHEMQDGSLPLDGSAVLVRFIVVGLFSVLFSRWCLHWMKRGR